MINHYLLTATLKDSLFCIGNFNIIAGRCDFFAYRILLIPNYISNKTQIISMKSGLSQALLISVILTVSIISIVGMFTTGLFSSAKEATEDVELPVDNGCFVDIDKTIDNKTYLEYVTRASKIAWKDKSICFVKAEGIVPAPTKVDIENAMNKGQLFFVTGIGIDCLAIGEIDDIINNGLVLWRGNQGGCYPGGVEEVLFILLRDIGKSFKVVYTDDLTVNDMTETLYGYPPTEFCADENMDNNNFERYSDSRGTFNYNKVCEDGLELPKDGGDLSSTGLLGKIDECIDKHSYTEQIPTRMQYVYDNVFADDWVATDSIKLWLTAEWMYENEYNKDEIVACDNKEYSYTGFIDDFALGIADSVEIDGNDATVTAYYDGACKFDSADWSYPSSDDNSCVYFMINGVWIRPSELSTTNFGGDEFKVKIFYKRESYDQTIDGDGCIGTAISCIKDRFSDKFPPLKGLDDIVIEFRSAD